MSEKGETGFRNSAEGSRRFTWTDLDKWNTEGYAIEKYGDDPSVLMVGETHYQTEEIRQQVDLIRRVQPKYILHEFARGWYYDPQTREYKQQAGRHFGPQEAKVKGPGPTRALIKCADELKIPIIGCDLTLDEIKQIETQLLSDYPDQYIYDEKGKLTRRQDSTQVRNFIPEIDAERETRMAQTIAQYQSQNSGQLVVILGVRHAAELHQHQELQDKGFGYGYIKQSKLK